MEVINQIRKQYDPLVNLERKDLSHLFMLEEFWIWEDDGREAEIIHKEMKTKVYQGEMELINIGCGMGYGWIVRMKQITLKITYMSEHSFPVCR